MCDGPCVAMWTYLIIKERCQSWLIQKLARQFCKWGLRVAGPRRKWITHKHTHLRTRSIPGHVPNMCHIHVLFGTSWMGQRDKVYGCSEWERDRVGFWKKNDTEGRFMHLSLFFCQHHVVRAVIRSCLKASQQRWLRYVRYAGYITRDTRFFQRFFWFYYHFFVGSIVCLCVSLDQWQKVFEVG